MEPTIKQEIKIERVLKAPVAKVWQAWTDPELLQKWWGPEGFTSPSARSDFRVGGKYVYGMHGPAGTDFDKDMYSGGEFVEIVPNEKLVVKDYFCDVDGNKVSPAESELESPDFPDEQKVTILFNDLGDGTTKLSVVYAEPETDAQWQAMLKSGMVEGWTSSLNKLAQAVES